MKGAWPQIERKRYIHNWHIDAIAEHLEAVSRREIKRLIINVPFRTMKSTLVNVAWPAWTWTSDPGHQFLCGSHAEKLAIKDNLKHRRLVASPWFRDRWGGVFSLTGDQNQKMRFENDQGGYRIGFGMTGGITGDGGDTIIVDDPHDRDKAQSDAERERALETFDQSIVTRLNDPDSSAIVIIMQRLHEQDLSGHLLAEGGWEHLMLPMEYDPNRHCVTSLGFSDPRGSDEYGEPLPDAERAEHADELLWPERFPPDAVAGLKKSLGSYGTSGQLQQIPTPPGGGIFKRDWWQVWDDTAAKEHGVQAGQYPPFEFIIGSLDTAFTEKKENDPSGMTLWGVWRDRKDKPQVMMVAAWEEWLDFNPLIEKSVASCKRFKVDVLLIEAKASGISVAQEIKRLHAGEEWGVRLLDPKGQDKVARAYAVQHIFEDCVVWAPGDENGLFYRWAEKVIDQMAAFPKSAHKDLTDTATQAVKYLRDTGLLKRSSEIEEEFRSQHTHRGRSASRPLYPV